MPTLKIECGCSKSTTTDSTAVAAKRTISPAGAGSVTAIAVTAVSGLGTCDVQLTYADEDSRPRENWIIEVGGQKTTVLLTDEESEYSLSVLGNVSNADATLAKQDEILAKFASTVMLAQPVSTTGQITDPIVIGDDYLAANGRGFVWSVSAVPGVDVGDAACLFGANNSSKGSFVVEGVVADVSDGLWSLTFDLARAETLGIEPGEYDWSVEVRDSDGNQITQVRNGGDCYKVKLVAKQT